MRGWLVGCLLLVTAAAQGGTVTGHGRFLKIAGNPSMGYSELYDGKVGIVSVLGENGNANPAQWKLVGWGNDPQVNADSDEWVRFNSGQIPLTGGKKYAIGVHIDGGEAIYKRNKDTNSYAQ